LLVVAVGILPGVVKADVANDNLVQMWHQFLVPKTLHATFKNVIDGCSDSWDKKNIETYEYWMDGQKYRCLEKSENGNGLSQDIRWNGNLFQWFTIDSGTLCYSKHPAGATPYYSIVPILRPFQFLFPLGRLHIGEKLTWFEACNEKTRKRLSEARLISASPGRIEAVFPGGKDVYGIDYTYHIEFAGVPEFLPTKITAVSSAGVSTATTEIAYKPIECPAGIALLPSWIRVTCRDPNNDLLFIDTSTLVSMEADKPIPPEIFTIDFHKVKSTYDLDANSIKSTISQDSARLPFRRPSMRKQEIATAKLWSVNWVVFALIVIIAGLVIRTALQKPKKR
jgi:hypothetical protein